MSSSHLLIKPVYDTNQSLSFRASSATLLLSQHAPNSHTGVTMDPVDMSIAHNILQTDSPRVPRRRCSLNHISANRHSVLSVDNGEQTLGIGLHHERRSRQVISSNTWTSSSGEISEDDGNENRTLFVKEYNRLARKYCVQNIVPDESIAIQVDQVVLSAKPGSWLMRKLLRRTPSVLMSDRKPERYVRHRRSVTDMSLRAMLQKDGLKGKDLAQLVRLCGVSPLYLPVEYAAGTLAVPTCFRATAQYLVQHATTSRGIFRIPGAHSTVNALYNHYASEDEGEEVIYGTVRCPTLPEHIQCNVHDVASAFKKFLAGLPGGILGKLWLFNAFLSIYAQFDSKAEAMRTKQSKVRARLIALAIATIAPRHRRELICAVMGLLSMIGRAAEIAPREDENGRPLPTSDLMGYGALGIVFGPLLLGDLLNDHDLRPTGPNGSLVIIHRSPCKSVRDRHKKMKTDNASTTLLRDTEKIRVVNSIAEMLITHWRDIVRHMKDLGALKSVKQHHGLRQEKSRTIAPLSPQELFTIRRPSDWDLQRTTICNLDQSRSPTPPSKNFQTQNAADLLGNATAQQDEKLLVRKRLIRPRPMSSQILSGAKSMSFLTPTAEEVPDEEQNQQSIQDTNTSMVQNTLRLQELQSNRKIHSTISKQASQSNSDKQISTSSHEASHQVECAELLSKLETSNSRIVSEHDEESSYLAQQALKEHEASMAKPIVDRTQVGKSATRKIKALSFDDSQNHNQKLRMQSSAINSPSGYQEGIQNQSEEFARIPDGILASRLCDTDADCMSLESSSEFCTSIEANELELCKAGCRPNTMSDSCHTFDRFHRDPLSRVSQEEDIASLASLAEVLKLQDELPSQECLPKTGLMQRSHMSAKIVKPCTKGLVSGTSTGPRNQDYPSKNSCQIDVAEGLSFVTRTISAMDTDQFEVMPRKSMIEPNTPRRTGGTSVKALAARFGNVETKAIETPSPVRTPDSQARHGLLMDKAIVATYTTNTSPAPMIRRLDRLDTSVKSISSVSGMRVRTNSSSRRQQNFKSFLSPTKSLSNPDIKKDIGPPRWQKLRPMDGSTRLDSDLIRVKSTNATNRPFSGLHRLGDGNASFVISQMSSEESTQPRPVEQLVSEHAEFAQPAGLCTSYYSLPFNFSKFTPVKDGEILSSSGINERSRRQNTSGLHTQIQLLSEQLKAKIDEADQLRRQLMTRDRLNDRATLIQHIREVSKEVNIWRVRAKEAERKAEILSRISEKEVGGVVEQSTAFLENSKSDYNQNRDQPKSGSI